MGVWCDRCDRFFPHGAAYRQHLANSYAHNYCFRCERDFVSQYALDQHEQNSPRHNICQICQSDFQWPADLDDHVHEEHWYCGKCNCIFEFKKELEEHYATSPNHHYCVPCKKEFGSASNLSAHRRSALHAGRTIQCPGCNRAFPSVSAMTIHLESGTCRSGATRQKIDNHVRSLDPQHIVTRPLLEYGDAFGGGGGDVWATEAAWNGHAYECYFCHRDFRLLQHLNQHLRSPVHQQNLYHCPQCRTQFKLFSALIQHIESGSCGISRFRQVQNAMNGLTQALTRRLAYTV